MAFKLVDRRTLPRALAALCCVLALAATLSAQTYQKPPQAVLDVLNAPVPPTGALSPTREYMLLVQGVRYPPITELAQPMLRLAGLRINPNTTGPHRDLYFVAMTLKKIADGSERKIDLPAGAKVGAPVWSADGKRFAFTNTTANGIELWSGEPASGRVWKLKNVAVNAVYGAPVQWMPDNRTLLVQTVPAKRGAPPAEDVVPKAPNIQESSGRPGPVRTYQDLLKNAHDEDLFDYYATAQLAFVDSESGKATLLGRPAIFDTVDPSPDGAHILVARLRRPYSYLHPADDFPQEVEVWDRDAKVVHKVVSRPLADDVPIEGVVKGPREYHWRPTEPATLVWAEALDDGDPRKKVSPRDKILMLKAPFAGQPAEVFKTEQRFAGMFWDERGEAAFVRDYDRDKRWIRTQLVEVDKPGSAPRVVWSHSVNERYNNPGGLLTRLLPNGHRVVLRSGDF